MGTTLEVEVKLACDDLNRLRDAGLELVLAKQRHFEDNWLLDSPEHTLFNRGAALRIRSVEGGGWVTYKGATREGDDSPLKIREEIEAGTTQPERLTELFERLGFHRTFRYQKYRTIYELALGGMNLRSRLTKHPWETSSRSKETRAGCCASSRCRASLSKILFARATRSYRPLAARREEFHSKI